MFDAEVTVNLDAKFGSDMLLFFVFVEGEGRVGACPDKHCLVRARSHSRQGTGGGGGGKMIASGFVLMHVLVLQFNI